MLDRSDSRLLLPDLIDEHLLGDMSIEGLAEQFQNVIDRLQHNPRKDAERVGEKLRVLHDLFDRHDRELVFRFMLQGERSGTLYHTFALTLEGTDNEESLAVFIAMVAAHLYLAVNGPSRIPYGEREELAKLVNGSGPRCRYCQEMFLFYDELVLHQEDCLQRL